MWSASLSGPQSASASLADRERRHALPLPRPLPFRPRHLRVVVRTNRYAQWNRLAESGEEDGRDQRQANRTSGHRVRNPAVHKAVLLRSGGSCENPSCHGPRTIGYTDSGDPILEIDHVIEHAKGGRDHGSNAIALCPNCHQLKSRGRDRHHLTEALSWEASRLHEAAMPGA
ncbi:HNH endonuclease [Streptomyces sp. NPDC055287]